MDLICHGVPSPQLFREYIAWLEEKNASQIKFYDFRDKRGGWGLAFKYVSKEHKYFKPCSIDPYYSYFLEGYTYRECCYKCRYCRPERTGDITIGDFWGIENEHPDFYSIKGVSCMLINTNKGLVTWRKYRYLYHSIESTFEKVSRENSNLLHPTERKNAIRDHIYDGIGTKDWFANVFASSFKPSNKSKIKAQIPIKFRFWMKWLLELIRFRSMRLHMRI